MLALCLLHKTRPEVRPLAIPYTAWPVLASPLPIYATQSSFISCSIMWLQIKSTEGLKPKLIMKIVQWPTHTLSGVRGKLWISPTPTLDKGTLTSALTLTILYLGLA